MNTEERIEKLKKFTQDPDWALMTDLILGHLAPLQNIMTIDRTKSNDEIASEVRGRQLSIEGMTKFLNDAKIINGNITSNKTSFK